MATARLLVVDDEDTIRESLALVLKNRGYDVQTASNGVEALEKITASSFDVVISDIEMPQMTGIELLQQALPRAPQTFFIIATAFASVETAIDALREGAYDYLTKPLNYNDLFARVEKILRHRAVVLENQALRQELQTQYDFHHIIGQSPPMQRVFRTIQTVAQSDGTVLIAGKSGSGKELVARAIHYNSSRARGGKFVAINCGAIAESLIESQLFGHKRGAFTGAQTDRPGFFQAADRGTLFLDEIGEMPLSVQVKLLRVLEQKEVIPVGGTMPEKVDARIIAATNRNLEKEVEAGRFREDLYYRLAVIEVALPSLAERRDDIPLLVRHFLDKYSVAMSKHVKGLTNDAMRLLMNYDWRGEVRELENAIERAVIFADGDYITPNELPGAMTSRPAARLAVTRSDLPLKEAVDQFEREYILLHLEKHTGHRGRTAKALGIGETTLYRKMSELGITGNAADDSAAAAPATVS